jgi:hypothetical protein
LLGEGRGHVREGCALRGGGGATVAYLVALNVGRVKGRAEEGTTPSWRGGVVGLCGGGGG